MLAIGTLSLIIAACSSGSEDISAAPPTADAVMTYLNDGWGEAACKVDGCYSTETLSVEPTDKFWVWCANNKSTTGTPYFDNDGNLARVDWDEPKIMKYCYRISTDQNGKILYIESAD